MKPNMKRIVVDILLVFLLVFEMLYLVTGNLAHEIVGVVFFVCLAFHLYLSRKMTAGLFAKSSDASKGNSRRKALLRVIDLLLFAAIALLAVSSVFISNLLVEAGLSLKFGSYGLWALIHTISAYALCIIVVFHGALHWASLFKGMRVPYNSERRQAITSLTGICAALGAVALGVAGADTLKNHVQSFASEQKSAKTYSEEASAGSGESISAKEGINGVDAGSSSGAQRSSRLRPSDNTYDSSNSTSRSPQKDSSFPTDETGICPLCRKQCPLSNPNCNKPYQAGLL